MLLKQFGYFCNVPSYGRAGWLRRILTIAACRKIRVQLQLIK
ncbi:hypothetical protein HMPREF9544_04221 [Escherichia coli MS 153-1]|nr:hypothetical protein HMPREF9549_03745 [Escherichia coli MS 185-1]EFU50702.1 hypothetical protein HMPREF9544_04221 [Escherichia coli MS 153-1]KXG91514.1 hypothetical protein HMPREF3041_04381 [Escherichia coli]